MSKFCDKCADRNIGCELIQRMNKDIRDYSHTKHCFWWRLYIITGSLFVVIFAGWVVNMFFHIQGGKSNPAFEYQINICVDEAENGQAKQKLDYYADHVKCELETAFQKSFFEFGDKISAEYEKKFATLLVLLTILGIVFPIIIALIQREFTARELAKIDDGLNESKSAFQKAEEAQLNARESLEKAKSALEHIHTAMSQLREQKIATYGAIGTIYHDLATKNCEEKSSSCLFLIMSIYSFLLAANEDINRLNPCISSLISKIQQNMESANGERDGNFYVELEKTINLANEILVRHRNTSIQQIREGLLAIQRSTKN